MTGPAASDDGIFEFTWTPLCTNEDHAPRKAVVRTTWPSGRFVPGYACRSCLRTLLTLYVTGPEAAGYGGPFPLMIEPLNGPKAVTR